MSASPPSSLVMQLINGFWKTQAVYVAAKLGLADHLATQPQSARELAPQAGVAAQPLHRLLRALASLGVFAETANGRFAMTPAAECLRSDVVGSLRPMALMRGAWQYQAWGELLHCITTGESAFEKLFQQPMFEFIHADAARGSLFDAAMTSIHGRETDLILQTFDFGSASMVVDVGGGNGSLLAAILRRHQHLQGVLFDLPSVIERARLDPELADVSNRLTFASGNFFEAIPRGGDLYLMRHIIHDWNDEQTKSLLKQCCAAMGPDSRLLIAEFVIPPGNDPFLGKWFDLAMLVGPGGQERTLDEYSQLISAAGLTFSRLIPTSGELSLLEVSA